MKKKQYFAPELDVLVLEQTDIITSSSGEVPGGIGGGTGTNPGGGGGDSFSWGD